MINSQHELIKILEDYIQNHNNNKRIALSKKYPILKTPILFIKKKLKKITNIKKPIAKTKSQTPFSCILARHQSVLRRTLGDSDPRLQEQKITNLKKASEHLNGLIIQPGEIFSFWESIGEPSYGRGFVNGMLLSNGKVLEGAGGGLCQMANLLMWLFLHVPVEIVERYHHSLDVFPDSGRTIPFGSGATVMYNFIDLQIKNTLPVPLQLSVWEDGKYLKGRILSPRPLASKWHVVEKNHCFVMNNHKWFRYNEIWQAEYTKGIFQKEKLIFKNFAPILYAISTEYIEANGYTHYII